MGTTSHALGLLLFLGAAAPGCGGRSVVGALVDGRARDTGHGDAAHSDAALPCEDPAAIARLPGCLAASSQAACVSLGGRWAKVGMAQLWRCVCPSGQGACSCSASDRCPCQAELPASRRCEEAVSFHCQAELPTDDCVCQLDPDGRPGGMFCSD